MSCPWNCCSGKSHSKTGYAHESAEETQQILGYTDEGLPSPIHSRNAVEKRERGCGVGFLNDAPFALLFIANTAALVALFCLNYDSAHFTGGHEGIYYEESHFTIDSSITGTVRASVSSVLRGVGWGLGIGLVWTLALGLCPRFLLIAGTHVAVIVPLVMSCVLAAQTRWVGCTLCIVIGLLMLCWIGIIRKRIPVAAVMLEFSSQFLMHHAALLFITLSTFLLHTGYLVLWICSLLVTIRSLGGFSANLDSDLNSGMRAAVLVYYLLSYFWSTAVAINLLHVTFAGVFADWWIQGLKVPCFRSFYRAFTCSFGSICYGSCIIAPAQALQRLICDKDMDSEGDPAEFFWACATCLAGCSEYFLEFINPCAFVHVAMYGSDFCTAGIESWAIIKDAGFDRLIKLDFCAPALTICALSSSVGSGASAYLVACHTGTDNATKLLFAIIASISTFSMTMLLMVLVKSCVDSIYLLYCEMPTQGTLNHPDKIKQLTQAWMEAHPEIRWQDDNRLPYFVASYVNVKDDQ